MHIIQPIKKLTIVLAMLMIAQTTMVGPVAVQAGTSVVPTVVATSSSSGGWIIGGLFFSVASIIACSIIVGAAEGREMTLEEALLSGSIPLGCLLREEFGVTPQ